MQVFTAKAMLWLLTNENKNEAVILKQIFTFIINNY